jgi:oxalate decarboxylase
MNNPGRRDFLTAAPAALVTALLASNPVASQDLLKPAAAQKDKSVTDPGPENTQIRDANPNTFLPPVTDHGEAQTFGSSFSAAHRRIQEGSWSRQVTVEDFPISKDIAGVKMRLAAGGIRESHWHNAAEWALTLTGAARLTAIDAEGRSFVKNVGVNDLWFFPTGPLAPFSGLLRTAVSFCRSSTTGNVPKSIRR